jgi:hypothetical protein
MKSHVELLARYAVLLSELSIVKQGLYDWFSSLSLEEKLKVFLVDTFPLDEILKKEPYILNFKKEPWERRSDCDYFEFVERHEVVSLDRIFEDEVNYYLDDDGELVKEDSLCIYLQDYSIDDKVKFILDDDSISSRYLKQMLEQNVYCFEYDW